MSQISHLKSNTVIHGDHNRSASFSLFAFEYQPTSIHPEKDWIEIDFHLKDGRQEWHVTDASLTAEEVIELVQWLNDIANHREAKKDLYFLEPNLSFHLMCDYGKSKNILITFNAELRPEWYNEDGQYAVSGHIDNRQLSLLADSLSGQLNDLYIKAGYYA